MNAALSSIRFAGYAALFDICDAANDTIERGAFAKTIAARPSPIPLYWQHRPDQSIGIVTSIAEDTRGLRVIGKLDNAHTRAAQQLIGGNVSGLSFGYRAQRFTRRDKGRRLTEVDLFEISLVTHPLQHGARVHLVV